jgi:4-carboxymuconolactone decarboxylase
VFGEQGVIELVAIAGYYAMLAMVLNVGRKALPAGQEPQLPWFPN